MICLAAENVAEELGQQSKRLEFARTARESSCGLADFSVTTVQCRLNLEDWEHWFWFCSFLKMIKQCTAITSCTKLKTHAAAKPQAWNRTCSLFKQYTVSMLTNNEIHSIPKRVKSHDWYEVPETTVIQHHVSLGYRWGFQEDAWHIHRHTIRTPRFSTMIITLDELDHTVTSRS